MEQPTEWGSFYSNQTLHRWLDIEWARLLRERQISRKHARTKELAEVERLLCITLAVKDSEGWETI
jgi:cell division protein FtsL